MERITIALLLLVVCSICDAQVFQTAPGSIQLPPNVQGAAWLGNNANRALTIYYPEYSFNLSLPGNLIEGESAFVASVGLDHASGQLSSAVAYFQVLWNEKLISSGNDNILSYPALFPSPCLLLAPGDTLRVITYTGGSTSFTVAASVWFNWLPYNTNSTVKCVSFPR